MSELEPLTRGDEKEKKAEDDASAWRETYLMLNLAIPTVIIQLSFTFPPFLTASYVGRTFGPVYLDGFQLANLTGNLFTLSLLQGLYSASDTLSPQAYGAGNYREIGLIAMRGYVGSMAIILPVCLSIAIIMRRALTAFGEDPEASLHAANWYAIYIFSLPLYAIYMVTWKFLSAQNTMMPLVVACIISCCIVLPLALEILTRWIGFLGSAFAIVVFQFSQVFLVLGYLRTFQPHIKESWPGLGAWRELLHWEPFRIYFYLGAGGMIASSEWIYWETLSLVIGTLGVIPLSVHTVPTQLLTVSFMIPWGIGIALAVRLGATLPRNVLHAKHLTVVTFIVSTILFSAMTMFIYIYRDSIFRIFVNDPDSLAGCERIWWKVCVYFFSLSIFALDMGVATGLGMQWTLGIVTLIFLWIFGLPAAWYLGVARAHSLDVVWDWIYPPYVCMDLVLMVIFLLQDWDAISENIRKREGVVTDEVLAEGEIEASDVNSSSDDYGSMQQHNSLLTKPVID